MAASEDTARPASELYIGLMSGTSIDGVDAVLADLSGALPRTLAHTHRPFSDDLRAELAALARGGSDDEIERSQRAALRLAEVYAHCVALTLAAAGRTADQVRAIGAHGQTIRHRPALGFSVQLNAPAHLAEATGIDVVADFRSRDVAAGGQGAPLVPAFHAAAFASAAPRAVVNIGGISNITALDGAAGVQLGFDCGPGNVLLDLNIARYGGKRFDDNGDFAASGTIDEPLLQRLMSEPFLHAPPPKSTGRELFGEVWLDAAVRGTARRGADIQRTLTEYTALTIGDAIRRWWPLARDIVVCGGGARNAALMSALRAAVDPRPVVLSDALGVPSDHVEALAFAWLAQRCIKREPGSIAAVTGAQGARVLGAIYPR